MKEELNRWRFYKENEDCERALSRFLIAFEELRVRLAPAKYRNIEITDEGYLWFNMETSLGTVEVVAFPFGLQDTLSPSIAVSLPRKAENVSLGFLSKLHQISDSLGDTKVIAKQVAEVNEILGAFERNEHPQLAFASTIAEISEMKRNAGFFSYLGILFPIVANTLSDIERKIRTILRELEGS